MPRTTLPPIIQLPPPPMQASSTSTSAAAASAATSVPSTSAAVITQTLIKTNVGSQTSFCDLPTDLFGSGGEIFNHLGASDFRRLVTADPKLFPSLRNDKGAKEKFFKSLHELLTHIINADLSAAEAIIKNDPGLLLEEGQVTQKIDDETSYCYKGTALSIALELGDVSIYPDQNEEMAEMIIRYLKTLPNGEAYIARQIQTYFPHGFVEVKPYDFNAIRTAIINSSDADVKKALKNDPNDPPQKALYDALDHFRIEFAECPRNVCHISAAFTAYDNQFKSFNTWEQRELFCIQVIGFVQRYLPLCDRYAFKQGIYEVVENKQRLTRYGFEFIGLGVAARFPGSVLHCLTGSCGAWAGGHVLVRDLPGRGKGGVDRRPAWQTFVEQKQRAWRTLYERFGSHIQPRILEGAASCSNTLNP